MATHKYTLLKDRKQFKFARNVKNIHRCIRRCWDLSQKGKSVEVLTTFPLFAIVSEYLLFSSRHIRYLFETITIKRKKVDRHYLLRPSLLSRKEKVLREVYI